MNDTQNQKEADSVDPLAQLIVDTVRKMGGRAWLGFPPPEEMERLKAEKAERDFQARKRWHERKDRKMAELKKATREVIKQSRDKQC